MRTVTALIFVDGSVALSIFFLYVYVYVKCFIGNDLCGKFDHLIIKAYRVEDMFAWMEAN